jgi:ElaA protein
MSALPTWTVRPFKALSVHELYALLKLRTDVFVVEQQCPYAELDGQDEGAFHLLGTTSEGGLIAYARILPPHDDGMPHIGRVVVDPAHRGLGLGKAIMHAALEAVRTQFGAVPVALSAQAHLQPFYEGLGFVPTSEPYMWDGIPHVDMVLSAEG